MNVTKIKPWTTLLIVIMLLCGAAQSAVAATRYVKQDSPSPSAQGSTWETAFHTVQAALDAAASGDQIWVAAGTYYERITLKNGVALYGGFVGAETALDQRDWQTHVTILDGQNGGSVVTASNLSSIATRIDGFTIRNGFTYSGAGISCSSSSPTISNNTISGNTTRSGGSGGGGIYCSYSSPTISNNTISGNTATYGCGGGICCDSSSPTISNNTISGNTTLSGYGGGIYCRYSSSTIISNNTISENTANYGAIFCSSSSPAISNNIVAYNNSEGIYVFIYDTEASSPPLSHNCVYGNTDGNYYELSAGITDIQEDPLFVDRANGNLRLQTGSPCIDAGDDSAAGVETVDLDGKPRKYGAQIDIGAYEWYLKVVLSTTAGNATNIEPIPVAITFNKAVTGFDESDLTIVNGIKSNFMKIDESNYTVNIIPMGQGTVTVYVAKGAAQDASGSGNENLAAETLSVIYDTIPPASPSIPDMKDSSDTGTSNTDNLTGNNTPTFTGTAEVGSTVRLYADGAEIGSTTATGGNWSITPAILADGTYIITAKATDAAGNTSSVSAGLTITIDTAPPAIPSKPDLAEASDTGISNMDNLTGNNTPTFTGMAEAGSTVRLYTGGAEIGSATATDGNWSITSATLTDGTYTITAQANDAGGNTGSVSTGLTITIDTTPPAMPSTPDMTDSSDTGISNTDNITGNATSVFTGTVEAGSTVRLYAGGAEIGSVIATGGNWSITSAKLADGTYDITAQATDVAGNTGSLSNKLSVKVDTTPPVVSSINRISPSGSSTNAISVTYQVTFNETVSGIDTSDFTLIKTGTAVGTIASVTANSGITVDVVVNSISGDGSLRLDLKDSGAGIIDLSGNPISGGYTNGQTYTIDNTFPTGSLSINGEAVLTHDPAVTLTITADDGTGSGISQMRFSNDDQSWSAWEDFSAAKSWTLEAGDAGTCTVYVGVQDAGGNTCVFSDTIVIKAVTPVFSPADGTFNAPYTIIMTCPTAGVEIRYTTDGSDPTETSTLYDGFPALISSTATVTARAFKTGWTPSDSVNAAYTITSFTNIYQPVVNNTPTLPNLLQTAQNFRNSLSVQYNSASLWLGKGSGGNFSDLWLYFPYLIGSSTDQIPTGAKIVSAKLVLTLKEVSGNQNQPRGFTLYQITDPNSKGAPYFGDNGIRNGLDFQYRDHRPGRNIKWSDAAADITALFGSVAPVDTYELISSVFQTEGYSEIGLDVTASIEDWLSGGVNQGWFLTADETQNWGFNDGFIFYGATEAVAARRPRLEISYISAAGDNIPPDPVTGHTATSGNQQVQLNWTNPSADFSGVVVLRKAGVIPAYPTDGTIVYDGPAVAYLDNQGLTNGKTYYYAIFVYDSLRNYSRKAWLEATPMDTGTAPNTPSGLTVSLSGNMLSLNWTDNSDNENWFIIEQQESGGVWVAVAYPGANKTSLTVQYDNPNFALKPSKIYQYRIKAVNAFGSSVESNISDITTPGFPLAPTGLTWKIISSGRVNLNWTDNAGNETGYRIDVCSNDIGHTVLRSINLPVNANWASITGLTPGTNYLFKVSANNTNGKAAVWTDIIVTTPDTKGGIL